MGSSSLCSPGLSRELWPQDSCSLAAEECTEENRPLRYASDGSTPSWRHFRIGLCCSFCAPRESLRHFSQEQFVHLQRSTTTRSTMSTTTCQGDLQRRGGERRLTFRWELETQPLGPWLSSRSSWSRMYPCSADFTPDPHSGSTQLWARITEAKQITKPVRREVTLCGA